jgi:hypothetical protein
VAEFVILGTNNFFTRFLIVAGLFRNCAIAQGDPDPGAGSKVMMFYWRMPLADHDSFSGQQGWNSQLAEIYDSA